MSTVETLPVIDPAVSSSRAGTRGRRQSALWRIGGPRLPVHPSHYVAEDLNGLSADDLRNVLSGLDQTLNGTVPAQTEPGLNELSPEQLKAVLRSLEG